jgi:hypothetical protein
MADWVTISAFATAGGTLVLAGATFASVRSANRAARVAEQSLLANLRPLLVPSRLQDAPQKVGFVDDVWLTVPGGGAAVEVTDQAIYLAFSIRNVGSGIGVLHGWRFYPEPLGSLSERPELDTFTRLTRDLYVSPGDEGFWQGAFRDPSAPEFAAARTALDRPQRVAVDLLYGDSEGGQRAVSRFTITPREDGAWLAVIARHWNVDRADPR